MSLNLEAGEADYFSAILAMQNSAPQVSAMPEVLKDVVESFKNVVRNEGVNWSWPKANLLNAEDLATFGISQNLTVFLKADKNASSVFALNNDAIIALSNRLLGSKPVQPNRAPTQIETLISIGFVRSIDAGLVQIEEPQTAIAWMEFIGVKQAFNDEPGGAFIVAAINRRVETTPVHDIRKSDVQHQNHIRHTIGNGVLNVDYILDGGAVSLSLLRNLQRGSVLPLASLSDAPLHARANGKTVFSGVLNLKVDQMAMKITRILTGGGHE